MNGIYKKIIEEISQNKAVVLTTQMFGDHEGTTNTLSRKLYIEDQQDLEIEKEVFQVMQEGTPRIFNQLDRMNHENRILAEPFYPKERLIILGGGHIAIPLVEIATKVGFRVTVVDDRPTFANTERFPTAEQVICDSFGACFDQIKLTRNDYIVIITRGHKHDTECLRRILMEPETIYVGMIGSKRRISVVKEELFLEGAKQERLDHLCSPIGLDIGSTTPEEISISILAELIKRKRKDRVGQCMVNRSDLDSYMLEELSKVDRPCCLATIIETKGSVPRGRGSKMLIFEHGEIIGSIGGGCSESEIMQKARGMIGSKTWCVVEIDMTADAAEEDGMVCGGLMWVLLEDFDFEIDEVR